MHDVSLSSCFFPSLPPLCEPFALVDNADVRRVVCESCRFFFCLLCLALRVLVSADLLVLPLTLLHEFLEHGIIVLGDSLGRHLDDAVAVGPLDLGSNLLNGRLQHLDTQVLVEALAGQDVQWGSHQLDLDLVLGGVVGLGGAQSVLDGVDSIVTEAGDFDVGTDLGRVGGKLFADVQLQLLLHGFGGELGVVPDFGVAVSCQSVGLFRLRCKQNRTYEMEILNAS